MGNLKLCAGGGKGITKWDQSGWDASARLNTLNRRDKLLRIAAAKTDISRPHGAGFTVLGIAWLDGLSESEEEKKIENSCFYLNFKQGFCLRSLDGCILLQKSQNSSYGHPRHNTSTTSSVGLGLFHNMLTRNNAHLLKCEHLLHPVIKHSKHLNTAPLHLHIRRRNTTDG